jgi:hypothetical protein
MAAKKRAKRATKKSGRLSIEVTKRASAQQLKRVHEALKRFQANDYRNRWHQRAASGSDDWHAAVNRQLDALTLAVELAFAVQYNSDLAGLWLNATQREFEEAKEKRNDALYQIVRTLSDEVDALVAERKASSTKKKAWDLDKLVKMAQLVQTLFGVFGAVQHDVIEIKELMK